MNGPRLKPGTGDPADALDVMLDRLDEKVGAQVGGMVQATRAALKAVKPNAAASTGEAGGGNGWFTAEERELLRGLAGDEPWAELPTWLWPRLMRCELAEIEKLLPTRNVGIEPGRDVPVVVPPGARAIEADLPGMTGKVRGYVTEGLGGRRRGYPVSAKNVTGHPLALDSEPGLVEEARKALVAQAGREPRGE